ncbi:MAG: response regulator [Verrucomicrobiota bacterium]
MPIPGTKPAPLPADEKERLEALYGYQILDTEAEQDFDDLTLLAAHICGVPISLISLIDEKRQWFKSKVGLEAPETHRDMAFCSYAIHDRDVMTVPDAVEDGRFAENPLVKFDPKIRFYAGAPLVTSDNYAIGTLCVIDRVPRELTDAQKEALQALSRQVMAQIEMRRVMQAERRYRKEIEEAQGRLTDFLDNANDLIQSINPEGKFLYVNRRWKETLGYSEEDLKTLTVFDLMSAECRQHCEESFARIMAGENIGQVQAVFQAKDGRKVELEGSVNCRMEDGRPMETRGIYRDVTERRQAEREKHALAERLLLATKSAGMGIWEWNLKTDQHTWDAQMRALYGMPPDLKESYQVWENSVSAEDAEKVGNALKALMDHGTDYVVDFEVKLPDGSQRTLQARALVERDEQGRTERIVGVNWDITNRKQLEVELARARDQALDATKAKSEFLANMSHEIRTPMNGVIGMTTLLGETKLDEEQRDFVNTIRTSADALLALINDILDFSKIESGKMELDPHPVELRRCIAEALDLLAPKAAEKGIDTGYLADEAVPELVTADGTRLRQVLINLLSNAVKFTDKGGVVVRLAPGKSADEWHFAVEDSGVGVPADKISRLFQSFSQADSSTTRHYGGTGLGLAICKRLVEMMGGRMWVDSQPGVGSTFHFSLRAKAEPGDKSAWRQPQPVLKGKRLLIVEDNAQNREIVQQYGTLWGMGVELAGSVFEALERAQNSRPYDVVLLDHQLAGTSGFALWEQLRGQAACRNAQPLLLSNVRLAADAPLKQAVYKPIRRQQMLEAILRVLAVGAVVKESPVAKPVAAKLAEQFPGRILVADDNVVNLKVASAFLTRMGYQPDTATNGREVLQALAAKEYNLVLLDIQMPELDGYQVASKVISQAAGGKRPHLIALTANAMESDRQKCLAAGLDDYLPKPIRVPELEAILRKYLAPE